MISMQSQKRTVHSVGACWTALMLLRVPSTVWLTPKFCTESEPSWSGPVVASAQSMHETTAQRSSACCQNALMLTVAKQCNMHNRTQTTKAHLRQRAVERLCEPYDL